MSDLDTRIHAILERCGIEPDDINDATTGVKTMLGYE